MPDDEWLPICGHIKVDSDYPKQAEKVTVGSTTPISVPGILAVYPEMKWYMAWSKVSLLTGGSTPKASQDSMIRFLGWPTMHGIWA
jgi:hypothetical protein